MTGIDGQSGSSHSFLHNCISCVLEMLHFLSDFSWIVSHKVWIISHSSWAFCTLFLILNRITYIVNQFKYESYDSLVETIHQTL